MHRWHHSNDRAAYQTNFATVFSIFDRMFGTYRVPGLPDTSLGVDIPQGKGVFAQLLHPFKPSAYGLALDISRKAFSDSANPKDRTNINRSAENPCILRQRARRHSMTHSLWIDDLQT